MRLVAFIYIIHHKKARNGENGDSALSREQQPCRYQKEKNKVSSPRCSAAYDQHSGKHKACCEVDAVRAVMKRKPRQETVAELIIHLRVVS